jgi:phosphoribosyl 1,2-cyclic phosphodiesterase
MLRFASLGSGSDGNALIVEVDSTRVMLDCGFGIAETETRLARLGLAADDLDAILVTHEHGDHCGGVAKFAAKHALPVWLTHGTRCAQSWDGFDCSSLREIAGYAAFTIGAIHLQPYPVPHDAREPAQFVFSDGASRLAVLTDTGTSTPHIEAMLSGCQALVLECNHDLELLLRGPYPVTLKERIGGRYGHLDNRGAAQLLSRIDRSGLRHVIAAHLSKQNNSPELARTALAQVLDCADHWIGIADQDQGFDWRSI